MSADSIRSVPHATTLDDVVAVSEALADSVPADLSGLRSELVIRRGDWSVSRKSVEREFPTISADYLNVIAVLDIEGVSIGLFSGFNRRQSGVGLRQWISVAPERDLASKYVVCWNEADPVLVGTSSAEVTTINHSTGIECLIARSFGEFLILASNLVAARMFDTGANGARRSVASILKGDRSIQDFWEGQARVAGLR